MRPAARIMTWTAAATLAGVMSGCGDGGDASTPPASARPQPAVAKKPAPARLAPGDAAAGKASFGTSCVACHTPDGGAKPHLGKDIIHSAFTAAQSDEQLVAFIKQGRDPSDPLNTSGIGMPPKGGNPALSEQDLLDLVAFIRARQQEEHVGAAPQPPAE